MKWPNSHENISRNIQWWRSTWQKLWSEYRYWWVWDFQMIATDRLWPTVMIEWFTSQILVSAIYAALIYTMTSQPCKLAHVIVFIFMCAMSTLISYSIALLIAVEMRVKSNSVRVFMALAISSAFMLVTGIWNRSDSMPFFFQWVSAYSYVRYAFEGKQ